MSKKLTISKVPDLQNTLPTDNTYRNLSQSELLDKVRLLHEQIFKTNKYLMEVHRLSIYNWDVSDTGLIMVELPETNKGFLLDTIMRLRGHWDPATNDLGLLAEDVLKAGWLYRVTTPQPVSLFGTNWKQGDYALYDETGKLYNVNASMLESLFTPIVPIESNTILIEPITQDASGIHLRAHVKLSPDSNNDIVETDQGLFSDAYHRTKTLVTIQEEAPTRDNTQGGLRIVYLPEVPAVMYGGWLYLVPPNKTNVD